MKTTLSQLIAMLRYESLMSWRRGPLRAIVVLLPAVLLLGRLTGTGIAQDVVDNLLETLPAEAGLMVSTDLAVTSGVFVMILVLFVFPLLFSELVPIDRHYGVRELLDSLPLAPRVYLTGKQASAWGVPSLCLLFMGLLGAALDWYGHGPFRVHTLVAFWLGGLIPLALFASQMGVMLAAGQPNRRRAILAGVLAVAVSFLAYFALPVQDFITTAFLQLLLVPLVVTDPGAIPAFPDLLSWPYLARSAAVLAGMGLVWAVTAWRVQMKER